MRRIALMAVLIIMVAAAGLAAQELKDLTRVIVPDETDAALQTLKEWLGNRGFEIEARGRLLVMRRGGILMNLKPIVYKGELDRIRVIALYNPKEQYKGSKDLEELALKLNRSQNFLQVFVDDHGDMCAASNLTFYDELTARVFDAFVDLFAVAVRKHILTEETLKMVK